MGKALSFFLAVLVVIVLALVYLNWGEIHLPREFDTAEAERCAQFREVDPEDETIFSLGYSGRIRQFLHGCF